MGQKQSTFLSEEEAAALCERWGDGALSSVEEASEIFRHLDVSTDGVLSRSEFSSSLGLMGSRNVALCNFLFDALDVDGNGELSFYEFASFLLTLSRGSFEDKLLFGFRLMDLDKNNVVSKHELVHLLQTLLDVLSSFSLDASRISLASYVDQLWDLLDADGDGSVTWAEYRDACTQHRALIEGLGSPVNVVSSASSSAPSARVGRLVFFGQAKWDFMLSVMLGLQMATERIPLRRSGPDSLPENIDAASGSVDEFAVSPSVRMWSYGASVFREVRRLSGVSEEAFVASVGIRQVFGCLLMGDLGGLSEMVSEGKSGSFFYFSVDNKMMIKTISHAEKKALRRMLPSYYAHLRANPDTLLSRIYGLYRLTIGDVVCRFVVMGNIFNASLRIDTRFDLKGSTVGRTVGPDVDLRNTRQVLKDLDFIEVGARVDVGPVIAPRLLAQIDADSAFLQAQGIIDYSLLVGVHKRDRGSIVVEAELTHFVEQQKKKIEKAVEGGVGEGVGGGASVCSTPVGDKVEGGVEGGPAAEHQNQQHDDSRVGKVGGDSDAISASPSTSSVASTSSPAPSSGIVQRGSLAKLLGTLRRSVGGGRAAPSLSAATSFPEDDAQVPRMTRQSVFAMDDGGMASFAEDGHGSVLIGEQVVFVGIIDILIAYEALKQGEHYLKRIVYDGKQISVVPPDEYAERFRAFMRQSVVKYNPDV